MLSYDISIISVSEYPIPILELQKHIFLLNDVAAIMALQKQRLFTINVELGLNRLITVAYASRISTLDNVLDNLRQLDLLFLHHLIVSNDVDARMRSQQGDLVHFLRIQLPAFNLDDVLGLQTLARDVNGNGDRPLLPPSYPQNPHNIQSVTTSYVINDRSILDLGHTQLRFTHVRSPF